MRPLVAAVVAALVLSACGGSPAPGPGPGPGPSPGPDPVPPLPPETFVGAGDIGWCGPDGRPALTADLLDGIPGTVFTTGDNAYFNGSTTDFAECYEPFWGRHKARTRPTPGNHEYHQPGAAPYFAYFGAMAGPAGRGYYDFDLAGWRIFALNSEISAHPGSPQYTWLQDQLAGRRTTCMLAYFHTPVFGSGANGSNPHMQAIWALLYDAGADVILAGHNHSYERFARQDHNGRADPQRGIRQFVVGTGGAPLTAFPTVRANSEVRNNTTWGLLKLTLRADRYEWEFIPVAGQSFRDSGNEICH